MRQRRTRESRTRDYEGFVQANLELQYISSNGDEARCRCPFHYDGDPSFSVNLRSGKWWCHTCQEGGGLTRLRRLLHQRAVINYDATDDPSRIVYDTKPGDVVTTRFGGAR
jgi:hypothetical protein